MILCGHRLREAWSTTAPQGEPGKESGQPIVANLGTQQHCRCRHSKHHGVHAPNRTGTASEQSGHGKLQCDRLGDTVCNCTAMGAQRTETRGTLQCDQLCDTVCKSAAASTRCKGLSKLQCDQLCDTVCNCMAAGTRSNRRHGRLQCDQLSDTVCNCLCNGLLDPRDGITKIREYASESPSCPKEHCMSSHCATHRSVARPCARTCSYARPRK